MPKTANQIKQALNAAQQRLRLAKLRIKQAK